jgi:hypothetical protein
VAQAGRRGGSRTWRNESNSLRLGISAPTPPPATMPGRSTGRSCVPQRPGTITPQPPCPSLFRQIRAGVNGPQSGPEGAAAPCRDAGVPARRAGARCPPRRPLVHAAQSGARLAISRPKGRARCDRPAAGPAMAPQDRSRSAPAFSTTTSSRPKRGHGDGNRPPDPACCPGDQRHALRTLAHQSRVFAASCARSGDHCRPGAIGNHKGSDPPGTAPHPA